MNNIPYSLTNLAFLLRAHNAVLGDIVPYSADYNYALEHFYHAATAWKRVAVPHSDEYAALEELIEISLSADSLRGSILVQLEEQVEIYTGKITLDGTIP